jgi:4-hydroxy-3-methylbut-2-enyl diphosphate reductase
MTDQPAWTFLAALRIEARTIRRGLRDAGRSAPVRYVGLRARRLAEITGPVCLAGVCGGVAEHLRPGDVVIATEVRNSAGTVLPCTQPQLLPAAAGLRVHTGPVATSNWLLRSGHDTLAASGILAVDMETYRVVAAAHERGQPVIALHVVADTPDRPLLSWHTVPGGWLALRRLRQAVAAMDVC